MPQYLYYDFKDYLYNNLKKHFLKLILFFLLYFLKLSNYYSN